MSKVVLPSIYQTHRKLFLITLFGNSPDNITVFFQWYLIFSEFSIVKLSLTLVVFLSFAIQFFVVVDLSLPTVRQYFTQTFKTKQLSTRYELVYRAFCVFIAMSLAIGIPNLEEIIPLVGKF